MQEMDSFYETAMRRGFHVQGSPLVVAEWNFNNIFEPTVTNVPDDQNWAYGKKYFPIKSVGNSIRPKASGIFAAFTNDAWTTSDATLGAEGQRYYTTGADPEKVYSYWICPTPSNIYKVGVTETGEDDSSLPDHYGVARGTVLLEYPEYLNMNKIKVLFNLGPIPVDWSIFLHVEGAPGDGYIEVDNPTVNAMTGLAEIWWNGTAWTGTQQLDESVYSSVDKIKIEVRAVDQPNKYLQIVEIAGGREIDLTNRVEDYSISYQMDDVDFIAPVGRMVSADGKITFNNTDLKINEQDATADFYGLLSGRCEYRIYVKYRLQDYGGGDVIMRTGTLFANDWQQQNEYEYSVELWDILKLIQTTKVPGRLFDNISLAKIVSQILDSVGLDNYNLDIDDFDDSSIVKYFWASGDETVFDVLDSLCKSYQAAIYVDEFGVIQLLTRAQIANETDTPVWTFKGENVGLDLADVQALRKKYTLQANEVTIKYNQMEANIDAANISAQIADQPSTSKVWEANDTVVLRAAPIIRSMSSDAADHAPNTYKDIHLSATTATTWPFKGKVNMDGELIEYDGKEYIHWNFSTTPPVKTYTIVKSVEEQRTLDKATYTSYDPNNPGIPGSYASNPASQNYYTGKLWVVKRDADEAGRQSEHSVYWNYGWMGMRAWTGAPGNASFPTRYVDPGGTTYNMANVQNYKTRPNWNSIQSRWSITESIAKCNNMADGNTNSNILVRNVGSAECREFGTRMKLSGDSACGGLIFYMSNATGYDTVNPSLTDPLLATRWYELTMTTTEAVDKSGRHVNEICLEVKNGNSMKRMQSTRVLGWGGPAVGSDGKWTIEKNKWYDIDIVVKDGRSAGPIRPGFESTMVEVYIDGQWIDTWKTEDNIKPTGLIGIHARGKTIAEFEYFYASAFTTNSNPGYNNDDNFHAQSFNFPAGTNVTKTLNLAPVSEESGFQSVLSLSTIGAQATVSSLKVKGGPSPILTVKEIGPVIVKPNTRTTLDIDGAVKTATAVDITYTSTQDLTVCWEYTTERNLPYGVEMWITPPAHSFYDLAKFGYLSSKHDYLKIDNPIYPVYTEGSILLDDRFLFSDDFGAVAHEVRDFEIDYDVKPVKGARIYVSNNKIRVVDQTYNPEKGIFTLANTSHRDEIVNGTEEITESDSIDHILMLYGYILEDKGEKTKVVKNAGSIRRYGPVSINLDADWIFSEAEANALGDWITEHWSEPMDTITLDVFSNTFSQLGDKVNIIYANANILSTWLYIISERTTSFDDAGLSTSVTLRRVR